MSVAQWRAGLIGEDLPVRKKMEHECFGMRGSGRRTSIRFFSFRVSPRAMIALSIARSSPGMPFVCWGMS